MKRIFSSLILIFVLPFIKFKSIFKDNFFSGLIIGAVFSLLVNIVSMQIQGLVEKQRVLEAIENEIVNNYLQANGDISTALYQQKQNEGANPFIINRKFSRNFWEQSSEPIQYVAQLDSETQIFISTYYNFLIPYSNAMIDISNDMYKSNMKDCFNYTKLISKQEQLNCDNSYYSYLNSNAKNISSLVSKKSEDLLKIFHPTQNRLNNPFLRFLMGSNSMRILSGK